MTSQKDQIQALITDIDGVLQKTTPRLPWVVSGEVTQQRQVLERVRNYLVTFQRRQIVGESYGQAGDRPDLLAHDIYYQPSQAPYQSPPLEAQAERSQAYGRDELSAQQMLQAIVQDMGYLRANVMQPLQSDLELLRQQRESLVQEIHQLESQRQGYAGQLPGNQQQMIAEFLQALMTRLQETLPQQVAQTLRGSNQQSLPYSGDLARSGSAPLQAASNSIAQGLGNIQVAQSQSDELLIKLDSTLSVVFESLQRNVQAYEESLSQGLDKMHSMGQQGEMMFTALISHLANQLGHEASSYLQPPAAKGLESARLANPTAGAMTPISQPPQQPLGVVNAPLFEQPSADATSQPFTLPFPGTEISSNFTEAVPVSALDAPAPSVDTAIDSWLRSASGVDATPAVDYELAELNLEGFDLNQLAAQDVNTLLELDANLLSTNLSPQPILAPTNPTALPGTNEANSGSASVEDTADIDAALKLLEQLSSELKEQPASVADADAQIDRMLSTPSPLTEDTTATGIPDDARDELDEFYESLFGNDAIAAQASLETPAAIVDVNQPPANAAASPTTQTTTAQPIDALPADTQAPKSTLVPPEIVAAPAVSAVVDPTLGWDLLAKPLSTQAAADIPVALLDDELLSGWDFEDAEIGLAETEPVTDGNELLGVEEVSTSSDRDPLADMPAPPTGANVVSSAIPVTASAETLLSDTAPAVEQPISTDEITTLADLFDETTPAEGLEASIANPIVLPESLSQPSPPPPAGATELTSPITANQVPADQADDRRLDDRYTPALPEEDLLPLLEEPVDEADSELWLDEGTLTRLSEDLFSLEETIVEPTILPYGVKSEDRIASEVNPSELYSDAAPSEVVAPGDAALTGTAFSSDEPTSLEDWSASLNDFADALSTNDSTQAATASEPSVIAVEPPGAFILEGMDDLFADTPAAPPVTAVPPPVVSTQADASAAFTLEGMDDLFADAPTVTTPLPPTSFPGTDQPLFTLEGIDDLFDGVPMAGSTPLPSAPGSPSDQSLPFTLEGVDELFADAPPVNVAPMGDALLTADALPPLPQTATTDLPVQFAFDSDSTLETTDDIFVPAPTASEPPPDNVSNRAIETSSDLLLDQSSEAVAPFTFEQIGDLFMEVPSGEVPSGEVAHAQAATGFTTAEQPVEVVPEPALAPFTLERVGDVFIEKPFEEAGSDLLTTPNPQSPSSPPTTEPSTLEQAFASLMGSFDDPMPATDGVDTQDPEKKK